MPVATPPETASSGGAIQARVLVVDDDFVSRTATAAALSGASNEVRTAVDGLEALQIARLWRPDLILLDVMMPGIDGFEVCRSLRTDPELADLRIFFLTSIEDRAARLTGFAAGADDFLGKPLDRAEALERIQAMARLNRYRALLRQHRAATELRDIPAPLGAAGPLVAGERGGDLDRAVATLYLVRQPIVRVASGSAPEEFAAEVLVRSREAEIGSAARLLAAALAGSRMLELGREVRRAAARMARAEASGRALFVNMTLSELTDDRLFEATDPLAAVASRIVIELTERESVTVVRDLRNRIESLRSMGYRIAIDDLGGGYSSLNNLALIEPDFVKLDQLLVRGVDGDRSRRRIVASMVSLCRELRVPLIAEGVETQGESRALLDLGAELQQGFLHGSPVEPS